MDPVKSVTSLDATKKAFSLFEEFKSFALKGNVIDLAIGVIIGGAFWQDRGFPGQERHHAADRHDHARDRRPEGQLFCH